MGDPTGLASGFIVEGVFISIKEILRHINIARRCRKQLESLGSLLTTLQAINSDLQMYRVNVNSCWSNPSGNFTPPSLIKWLEELDMLLQEANEMVQHCKIPTFNFISRYKMSKNITRIVARIERHKTNVSMILLVQSFSQFQLSIGGNGSVTQSMEFRDSEANDGGFGFSTRLSDEKMEENIFSSIRWRKGELIGCGAFGKVYKGMNIDSGELLAVKQVLIVASNGSKERCRVNYRALEAEVNMLRKLSHRNIVQYLGTTREEHALNILFEFVPGGSIASLLGKFGPFTELVIRKYTKQLLQGLEYLHNKFIMHRDIKGANILVDNKGCIKLADFGASKLLPELETDKSLIGTLYWMAPEVICQTRRGLSADIWGVGCTVIEMATGKPPWSQQLGDISTVEATLYHIATTKSHPPIPDNLSSEAKDFLLKCLKIDPKLRPSASELLEHPFVVGDQGS